MISPTPYEMWCYDKWQSMYQSMKGVQFIKDFSGTEQWTRNRRQSVVIDDLIAEIYDRVTKLFTKYRHRCNLNFMYTV